MHNVWIIIVRTKIIISNIVIWMINQFAIICRHKIKIKINEYYYFFWLIQPKNTWANSLYFSFIKVISYFSCWMDQNSSHLCFGNGGKVGRGGGAAFILFWNLFHTKKSCYQFFYIPFLYDYEDNCCHMINGHNSVQTRTHCS